MRRILHIWLSALLLALSAGGTACESSSGEADGGEPDAAPALDAESDVSLLDTGYSPDAELPLDADIPVVDASPNPHVYELPPSGQTEMMGFNNTGHIVTYSDTRGPPEYKYDIYYYDLIGMTEYQITNRVGSQAVPYGFGDEIMFDDLSFSDPPNGLYQGELYVYDTQSASEIRLTISPNLKSTPIFNQDTILFRSNEGCATTFDMNLSLMNRQTMDVTVVSNCDQDPETHSISEFYAAWTARPFPAHNKDIYVRDLLAGFTFRIESTDLGEQYFPHTDDDHVIWMDYRDGQREIYMYTLSTGIEECLTPDVWEQAFPHLRNGVASWCDYRFSQQYGEYAPCDIYVYEPATGVGRRVTAESKTWMPRFVDAGWILYALRMTAGQFKLYAHDLVGDGILTSDGHVIP